MTSSPRLKALLVGLQLPKVSDQEIKSSLEELARLVTTLGYEVVGQTSQKRSSERDTLVVGEGKLVELARWTGGPGIVGPGFVKKKSKAALRFEEEKNEESPDASEEDLLEEETEEEETLADENETGIAETVIFDCDLSPSQLRNLESALGVPVLDRTGVIIEIFSRHARTPAAKLQVEIARLTYVAPRLRETGGNEDRGGGGVGAKGAGETSLELDRRKIRDRIKELKTELASVSQEHDVRRARRSQELTVALVGYTNAGKSSLMRALTGREVLVADKLFATLDTTVRTLQPESKPKILVSDTVGFIKKLPHDLVASFKSTLDEALHASLLLYVVDSSDATFRSQLEVTRTVLAEVGASDVESLLILNKVDRLSEEDMSQLKAEFPEAVFLSAKDPADVARLRLRLIENFETGMIDENLLIPYHIQGAVGEVRAKLRILSETYNDQGVVFEVRGEPELLQRIKAKYRL
ncbi:MAG: GTPase HflX [Bdellovibrionaceae bacterium]|nr:GTPase HflX [Pseudobdellovibrionaceae bacterium]